MHDTDTKKFVLDQIAALGDVHTPYEQGKRDVLMRVAQDGLGITRAEIDAHLTLAKRSSGR